MNAAGAFASLRELGVPAFRTADAAARLSVTPGAANKLLGRLAEHGLLLRIRRGLWTLDREIDPLLLPEQLSVPYPSYVSLHTALYLHGMIEQIPAVTYAVTLGPAERITTSRGTFSLHHVAPSFFGGFDTLASGVKLASPEKALLDVLYLSGTRTRFFAALPELELPETFRQSVVRQWVARIESPGTRTRVEAGLERMLR